MDNLLLSAQTGDVGGIMGLLLGCSVLSIFELVDFFLYNCLRKMHGSTKGTNKTADSTGAQNEINEHKIMEKSSGKEVPPSILSNSADMRPSYFDGSAHYGIDFAHV